MKKLLPLALCCSAIFLSSCAQVFTKNHSFQETEGVALNGAVVKSTVKPMGGSQGLAVSAMIYSAGTGTLDGPFLWRVEATGGQNHEWLRVNALKVRTKTTRRVESFPSKHLGVNAKFEKLPGKDGKAGKTFAKYQVPGKLKVMPREDGEVLIDVDVSIRANGVTKREVIRFRLIPESKRDIDTVFLPAEIIRGIQGNPREWDW